MDERLVLPDSFWKWIDQSELDGCWIWRGYCDRLGYGRFANTRRKTRPTVLAHRLLYLALFGEIPANLELDHTCENTSCVNPAHLQAVTHKVNMSWMWNPIVAQRTVAHCPRNHPYTVENTIVNRKGQRSCRTCNRAWTRERMRHKIGYYRRHPEEASNG